MHYRHTTLFNDSLASSERMARRRDARIRKQHLRDLSDMLLLTAEQMDDSTRPTLTFCNSPIAIAVRVLSSRLPLFSSAQSGLRWRADSNSEVSEPNPDFNSASNTAAARKIATKELLHGHGCCGTEESLRQRFVLCHVIETYTSARLRGRG